MTAAWRLFRRELALAWSGGGPLLALGFYAATATLVPLAIGPSLQRLAGIAIALPWIAALWNKAVAASWFGATPSPL